MDPEVNDITLYHHLLQTDPPDNESIPTFLLNSEASSTNTSSLTLESGIDRYYSEERDYLHIKRRKLDHPEIYEFDLGVLYKEQGCTHYYDSDTTVSTIRTAELYNTAEYPIPTTHKERRLAKEHLLNVPFGFVRCPPATLHRTDKYLSAIPCMHRTFHICLRDTDESTGIAYWYWKPSLRSYLRKGCYNKATVDKPTKKYLQLLNDPKYIHQEHYKEGYNCYTVVPVDKVSLLVNQLLKRIQFSDITTYYSSYLHSQAAPKPNTLEDSKRVLAIRYNDYPVVFQRQATSFYFRDRAYSNPNKLFWRRCFNNIRLQDPWAFTRCGHYLDTHYSHHRKRALFAPNNKLYIYKSDQRSINRLRYFKVKPPIIDDPVHPFCVSHDYPTINRVFFKPVADTGNIAYLGGFKADDKPWVSRDPFRLSKKGRVDRLNWIKDELMRTWIHSPVMQSKV